MGRAEAELIGSRIHVRSQFKDKDVCKSIIGARWSSQARRWTYPLDMETCRRLRDAFGDDLVIGPELWRWATAAKAKATHLEQYHDVRDIDVMAQVDLPLVRELAPTMWAAMQNRPYQPVASYYMATARRCLNADQPGIGKTIETLGALIEGGVSGPVLVLAPRTSCSVVWQPEIERWLADYRPGFTVTQTAGLTPKKREEAWAQFERYQAGSPEGCINFLIANAEQVGIKKFTVCPAGICDGDEDWCPEYANHKNASETRRPFLHSIAWEAIVADETHKWLVNTRGKNATQVGYGFTKLRTAREDSPKYALSGTPLKGKKHNLFGTLNWLWPKTYTSKWRFVESFWRVNTDTVTGRGGIPIETKEITGEWLSEKAKQSFDRSMRSVMIRRTKGELRAINPAWMPPEKQYHDVWVEMSGGQKTHYRSMEKQAQVVLQGGQLNANGVLAEMTRLKQFALSDGEMVDGRFVPTLPSAKLDWLLQFLEERGIEQGGDLSDDVRKVVVASQFTEVLKVYAEALGSKGIGCYLLTGEVNDKERARIVDAFQSDDFVRVVLINTNVGGVSITLDAADDMVILDETWVPDDQEQVEDRVHRASNVTHQVDIWYVRTKDTVEEGIAKVNYGKARANHVVLDAQRGLKFAVERFGAKIDEERK